MNKRFIRVAVFCALTATAAPVFVGCSDDYDADIANLQDQINKINGIIGVSSDDMTAAIDQVVEQMQAKIDELSATVDGKVNTEELTAQVEALNALIDQKADPSAIQAESEKLAGLIEEANKAAADANAADREALEQQISELEGKQEEAQLTLNEALAGKVDANTLQTEAARLEGLIAEAKEIASGAVTSDQLNSMISSVQGQIEAALADKASTEDLTELQNKLNEAINGKITPAEVDEKLAEINAELTEAIGKKMDAALFNTLKTQLETAIAGKADPALVDEKVAALEASLETVINGKADAVIVDGLTEKLETAAADLATAQNELKALQELAENFGAAMAELTTVKSDLTELGAAIADLQDKDLDLTHYAQFVTLSDKVTTLESQYGDLSDSVATNTSQLKEISEKIDKFFNEEGEGTAKEIYTRLKTLEDWKSDVEEGLTGILDKVDVSGLEDGTTADLAQMLADITDLKEQLGLAAQDPDEGEEEGDDATANFYNKEEVDKKFNELQTLMESVFGANIQSLAYVPSSADRITKFTTLAYAANAADEKKDVILVQEQNTTVSFRVSPASAAKKIVDDINEGKKYAVTFEGMPIKGTHGLFDIKSAAIDANNAGIINLNVEVDGSQISNGQTWAVALGLKALDPVKEEGAEEAPAKTDYTDITSDYFVVSRQKTRINGVKVVTAKNIDWNLTYDKEGDVVNIGQNSWLVGTFTDPTSGDTEVIVGSETNSAGNLVASFGNIFNVSYDFNGSDAQKNEWAKTFSLDKSAGKVSLVKTGTTNLIGMFCPIVAKVTINGVNNSNGTARVFQTPLNNVTVIRGEMSLGDPIDPATDFLKENKQGKLEVFNLTTAEWSKEAIEVYLSEDKINEIATLAGLDPKDLINQAAGTYTSTKNGSNGVKGSATLTVKAPASGEETNQKTFKLTIPAGATIDAKGETILFNPEIAYDSDTKFKLNISISVPPTAKYPSAIMTLGPQWQNGEVLLVPSYTYTEKTETKDDVTTTWREVTGVSWKVPFTSLFNNFNTNIGTITGKGGNFTLSAINKSQNLAGLDIKKGGTTATAGSAIDNTFTIEVTPTSYNGGTITIKTKESYAGDKAKYELSGTIKVSPNVGGKWTLGKVTNNGRINDLNGTYTLTEGTQWLDYGGNSVMEDGNFKTKAYPSGNGLALNGFKGVKVVGATAADQNILDNCFEFGVEGNPLKFKFKAAAFNYSTAQTVNLKIQATTQFGTISGYEGNNTVTLTFVNNPNE